MSCHFNCKTSNHKTFGHDNVLNDKLSFAGVKQKKTRTNNNNNTNISVHPFRGVPERECIEPERYCNDKLRVFGTRINFRAALAVTAGGCKSVTGKVGKATAVRTPPNCLCLHRVSGRVLRTLLICPVVMFFKCYYICIIVKTPSAIPFRVTRNENIFVLFLVFFNNKKCYRIPVVFVFYT